VAGLRVVLTSLFLLMRRRFVRLVFFVVFVVVSLRGVILSAFSSRRRARFFSALVERSARLVRFVVWKKNYWQNVELGRLRRKRLGLGARRAKLVRMLVRLYASQHGLVACRKVSLAR